MSDEPTRETTSPVIARVGDGSVYVSHENGRPVHVSVETLQANGFGSKVRHVPTRLLVPRSA